MEESLAQLLVDCRRRDPEAMERLVVRFRPWAVATALEQVNDHDLAEDVAQEAFITAFAKLDRLRDDRAFLQWFRRIVRTHAGRVLRGRREEPLGEEDARRLESLESDAPSPRDAAERRELQVIVRQAMAKLPPADRQALELFYFEELPCAHVAELLQVPAGTVKRRLHDSRQRLRAMLLGHIQSPPRKPAKDDKQGFPF